MLKSLFADRSPPAQRGDGCCHEVRGVMAPYSRWRTPATVTWRFRAGITRWASAMPRRHGAHTVTDTVDGESGPAAPQKIGGRSRRERRSIGVVESSPLAPSGPTNLECIYRRLPGESTAEGPGC